MQVKRNDTGTAERPCASAAGPLPAKRDEVKPSPGVELWVRPAEDRVQVDVVALLRCIYTIDWMQEWTTLSDEEVQASVLSCLVDGLLESITVSEAGASATATELVRARIRQAFGIRDPRPVPVSWNTLGMEVPA